MKYVNANVVLPDFLVEELQKYVQGEYLYIPIKKAQRKKWGELSGYRSAIATRNREIIAKYLEGVTIEELSDSYYLSDCAIKKIIYTK
jgi:Mor family transcriptional regulator